MERWYQTTGIFDARLRSSQQLGLLTLRRQCEHSLSTMRLRKRRAALSIVKNEVQAVYARLGNAAQGECVWDARSLANCRGGCSQVRRFSRALT